MKKTAIAVALATFSTASLAQQVIVFGDSLSDIGQQQWAHKASYYQRGVAHPLYNEILAKRLGGTIVASSQGGTNYAYSGGVAVAKNNENVAIQPNIVVQKQIDTYLTQGAKPTDLHIVWSGGNDIAAMLARALHTENPTAEVLQSINEFAQAVAKQWQTLRQAGVNTAIFPTVPNVVYTPTLFEKVGEATAAKIEKSVPLVGKKFANDFLVGFKQQLQAANASKQQSLADFEQVRLTMLKDSMAAFYQTLSGRVVSLVKSEHTATQELIEEYQKLVAQASQATKLLNELTTDALNQVGGNVVRLDVEGMFSEMLNRPNAYGLTNTVGVACQNTTRAVCQLDNPEADSMLFADGFHPNVIAHQVMADYISTSLESPKTMGVITRLATRHSELALDLARQESDANRFRRQQEKTVSAIAHIQQGGGKGLHLGLKAQFTPAWQFSAIASQQQHSATLGTTQVQGKTKAVNATLRRDAQRSWIGSSVQVASTDYQTQRQVQLGRVTHQHTAKASGATLAASLFAGYEWNMGHTVFSALADVSYYHGKIAPFGEVEAGPTRLAFAQQRINQLQSQLGMQYRLNVTQQIQPFVSARWVKQWLNTPQTLGVRLNGSQFEVALSNTDRSWVNVQAGMHYQFARMPLTLSASFSQDLARQQAIAKTTFHAGLSYQF